jgi:hypothetical protein
VGIELAIEEEEGEEGRRRKGNVIITFSKQSAAPVYSSSLL